MPAAKREPQPQPQSFKNGEIHDWYRLVLGYSDHLVSKLLDEFGLTKKSSVIDPFSGSGTTAVECKKRGINCWAVDANPVGYFASHVKTQWNVDPEVIVSLALAASIRFQQVRSAEDRLHSDKTARYLVASGMVKRRWISLPRLLDIVALKQSILEVAEGQPAKKFLLLAAMNEFVFTASNVRFGPELYCGKARRTRIVDAFLRKAVAMAEDLGATRGCSRSKTTIVKADSRSLSRKSIHRVRGKFDAVITSPPYPTEHDYTRNTRLELAFIEAVKDTESLRLIKRDMMRSHTKGIYSTDSDERFVSRFRSIQNLVARIERKAKGKSYGFARLYGKVTNEYFGGMRRHFRAIFPLLKPGARCAYVVGEQSSYFQVRIRTAKLLGHLAQAEGFSVEKIGVWRERRSTGTSKYIKEHILYLRRPKTRKRSRKMRISVSMGARLLQLLKKAA